MLATSVQLSDLEFDIPVELGNVMSNCGNVFIDGVKIFSYRHHCCIGISVAIPMIFLRRRGPELRPCCLYCSETRATLFLPASASDTMKHFYNDAES